MDDLESSSMDRFARGPFHVGYERRVDLDALRRKRIAKADEQRRAAGLGALLVWKDENCRYWTDLKPQLIAGKTTALNGALLIEGKAPILFCSGGERDRVDRTMPWVKEVHTIPIIEEEALVEGLVTNILGPVLREYDLTDAKLGLDESNMVFHKALTSHFAKLKVEDGDTPMQQARMIKLDEEIVLLEEATAIADAVCATATAAVADGVRECEVAGEAMRTLFRLGGEYAHVITPFVASGEHMSPPHRICSDKLIRNRDVCFIDIGAMWNGYFADIGRMTIVGKPSRRQKEVYTAVFQGLQAGIATMRPGRTNLDVSNAIVAKIAEFGLEEHLFSLFIGHGIGMGANEPPYIGETMMGASVYELRPNMVFAVEPLVWV